MQNKNDKALLDSLEKSGGKEAVVMGKLFLGLDDNTQEIMLFAMGMKVFLSLSKEEIHLIIKSLELLMIKDEKVTKVLIRVIIQAIKSKLESLTEGGQENE